MIHLKTYEKFDISFDIIDYIYKSVYENNPEYKINITQIYTNKKYKVVYIKLLHLLIKIGIGDDVLISVNKPGENIDANRLETKDAIKLAQILNSSHFEDYIIEQDKTLISPYHKTFGLSKHNLKKYDYLIDSDDIGLL